MAPERQNAEKLARSLCTSVDVRFFKTEAVEELYSGRYISITLREVKAVQP